MSKLVICPTCEKIWHRQRPKGCITLALTLIGLRRSAFNPTVESASRSRGPFISDISMSLAWFLLWTICHIFYVPCDYSPCVGKLCTVSRPRARWYQLRGLPLVGSECVCPQCNSSFVITRGSAKPSAFGLPVHLSRAH